MPLKPSGEMYLETIYVLLKTKSPVHAIDIATEMNFSKPSVSRAMGLLKKDGYITVDETGGITLTERGLAHAQKIYERHTILCQALVMLGVDRETAAEDACKIEHLISDKSFESIKKHMSGR